jgi:hypothetical protein
MIAGRVSQRQPLFLRAKSVVALVDALGQFGFTETFQLPHERARYVAEDDSTVIVGYDGTVSVYAEGDGREVIGQALIAAGAAT